MDKDTQDRIDDFLLHKDTWTEKDKTLFMKWIEEKEERKRQYEFTKLVIASVKSASSKAEQTNGFRSAYDQAMQRRKHRRMVSISIAGIAAALVVGFFVVSPLLQGDAADDGNVRGGDDVFVPCDSTETDSVTTHATTPHK